MAIFCRLRTNWLSSFIPLINCKNKNVIFISFHNFKRIPISCREILQRAFITDASLPEQNDNEIVYSFSRELNRLNSAVRRTNRISRFNFDHFFNELKKSGRVNSVEGLTLLRCCGHLLVENSPNQRMELVQNVLNYLKDKNFIFEIHHYNALLKIYLENEHYFNPEEFLAEMSQKYVEPNRVTYEYLIAHYCEKGDTDEASTVLGIMQKKSFSINEDVFNSLIIGHFRANDVDGAEKVLQVMKDSDFQPSKKTYSTLLLCNAEKGNWENIQKIFDQMEDEEMKIEDYLLFRIIEKLAVHGYKQFIPEVLNQFSTETCKEEAINSINRLLFKNEIDTAYTLLISLVKPDYGPEVMTFGKYFIYRLVDINQDFDQIVKFCTKLECDNLNSFAIFQAAYKAASNKNIELLLNFLKTIRNQNKPVRPHFFWPIFAHYRNNSDEKGILETLSIMAKLDVKPNDITLIDFVFPCFKSSAVEHIIAQVKEIGFSGSYVINALVKYLIFEKEFSKILYILERFEANYSPTFVISPLRYHCTTPDDIPILVQILNCVSPYIEKSLQYSQLDYAGQFIIDSFFESNQNHSICSILLAEIIKHNISVSSSAVKILRRQLNEDNPEIRMLINQLTLNSKRLPSIIIDEDCPITEEREEKKTCLYRHENLKTKSVLRNLLSEYKSLQSTNNKKRMNMVTAIKKQTL